MNEIMKIIDIILNTPLINKKNFFTITPKECYILYNKINKIHILN